MITNIPGMIPSNTTYQLAEGDKHSFRAPPRIALTDNVRKSNMVN